MSAFSSLKIMVPLSFRSLFTHKVKSLIVGFIMFAGTGLVVMGTALLDSIDVSMARSVTSSIAGHIQIYSKDAKDELALFGGSFFGIDDIGFIPEFKKVKEGLSDIENISAIVPMGRNVGTMPPVNEFDKAIDQLREAKKLGDADMAAAIKEKIIQLLKILKQQQEYNLPASKNKDEIRKKLGLIEKALSEEFWSTFDDDPQEAAMFLETKIAPMHGSEDKYFMSFIGTDIYQFKEKFDRFEIVRGELPPFGRKGLLLSEQFMNTGFKHRIALLMDQLHKDITEKGKSLDKDATLNSRAKQIARQYRSVTFQLDVEETKRVEEELRKLMPGVEGDINALLPEFFNLTDENFLIRYKFFYDVIAPKIDLYVFDVGDYITLKTFTMRGYPRSQNLKVYGIYRFSGLEKSDITGVFNIVDMISFRELYGVMTKETLKELAEIKKEVGIADIAREEAEDALFGSDEREILTEREAHREFDEFKGVEFYGGAKDELVDDDVPYAQEAIDGGMALNAAVILKDPKLIKETIADIERLSAERNLGVKAVDWQTASGMVGQFIFVVRMILYIAIFIIFLVALVIINNSMIMATMERTVEIGTMRAIGAQTRFVLFTFLLETIILGLVSGGLGALFGAGLVMYFGSVGIPAVSDVLVFLFSGPKLYPWVSAANMLAGFVVIFFVSVLSTLYPAYVATGIPPVIAMQHKE